MQAKGIIFILSAPSGGGKSFVASHLLKIFPEIKLSISHTTRPIRVGEEDGKEYHFCTKDSFFNLVRDSKLLEYAEIYHHYYGTLKKPIIDALEQGIDVLFDIDYQGAHLIKKNITSKVVTIFLLPTDFKTLKHRLVSRANHHDEESLSLRSASAVSEIKTAEQYDYIVINDELELVLAEIKSIIVAERIRNTSKQKLQQLITKIE